MDRFQAMLHNNDLSLVVSLPENSWALAKAAMDAGADGLKFHINVEHKASGNHFGHLQTYRDLFQKVREVFTGPIGIVLGDSAEKVREADLDTLEALGFDYYSLYCRHIPLHLTDTDKLKKTFAVSSDFDASLLHSLKDFQFDGIEISAVKSDDYGSPLTLEDLLTYRSFINQVDIPVILPSQKKWIADDVSYLKQIGADVLMLGTVVIGTTESSVYHQVKAFKESI